MTEPNNQQPDNPAGHTITFVANSGKPMRNDQQVDLNTLKVNTNNSIEFVKI